MGEVIIVSIVIFYDVNFKFYYLILIILKYKIFKN